MMWRRKTAPQKVKKYFSGFVSSGAAGARTAAFNTRKDLAGVFFLCFAARVFYFEWVNMRYVAAVLYRNP
jgi:hypothetical protein